LVEKIKTITYLVKNTKETEDCGQEFNYESSYKRHRKNKQTE
jgi:hypothetical protein